MKVIWGKFVKIGIALLEMAKKDLDASKVLFGGKLYPQAVFHLQQSVEKAVKSFGIYERAITEDRLERFRHDPVKVYMKMVERWGSIAIMAKEMSEIFPEFKVLDMIKWPYADRSKLENILEDLKRASETYKLDSISEDGLERFLSIIARCREKIENVRKSVNIEREWMKWKEKAYRLIEVFDTFAPEPYFGHRRSD